MTQRAILSNGHIVRYEIYVPTNREHALRPILGIISFIRDIKIFRDVKADYHNSVGFKNNNNNNKLLRGRKRSMSRIGNEIFTANQLIQQRQPFLQLSIRLYIYVICNQIYHERLNLTKILDLHQYNVPQKHITYYSNGDLQTNCNCFKTSTDVIFIG